MVENGGEVRPDARQVYSSKYRASYENQDVHDEEDDVYGYGNTRRLVNIQRPDDDEQLYDGYHDTSEYIPAYARQDEYENSLRMRSHPYDHRPPHVSVFDVSSAPCVLSYALLWFCSLAGRCFCP